MPLSPGPIWHTAPVSLENRALGVTGIAVSSIGLGAGQLGLASVEEAEAERLIHGAVDAGITLIDTARSYGLSEERIGRYLGGRRQRVVLSTKVGYGVDGVPDWTAEAVTGGIDAALIRLRTDVIDIVHFHSCPLAVLERDDLAAALAAAVEAGKVVAAGYSGDNEELRWAETSGRFDVLETSFNVCDQGAADLLDRSPLGFIAKRPLANAPWRFAERPAGGEADDYWQRLTRLELGDALPPHELAIRFAAHRPGIASAIVGTSSLEHLLENIELAGRGPLPASIAGAVDTAYRRVGSSWRQKT